MNIIFVGSIVDSKTLSKLVDASVAGNKMQLGFVKGFNENGVKTDVISVEANAMWKFNNKPIVVSAKTIKGDGMIIQTVPYVNLPIVKQCCVYINILKQVRKQNISNETILVVYNTMSMFALPVLKMARRYKCKAVAIVADLPILGNKNFVRKIEDRNQEKWIAKFDGLIPLTKYIPQRFAPNVPYLVVEAGCNENDYCVTDERMQNVGSKKVVFAGTLNSLSGIELIVEAMEFLKKYDIELHIYGDGPLREKVEKATINGKIIYHGRVNNEQMLEIQRQADLLVCPRCADDYTTKYTFPSKILEYVCAGVPVLSNRLKGIPDEYEDYINYSDSEQPEDWANAIIDIVDKDRHKYWEKAEQSKLKVLKVKNWNTQCKQVISFLKSL